MVIEAKLIRLTNKIAIQLYLMAESCTVCSSRARRPVWKLWIHPRIRHTDSYVPESVERLTKDVIFVGRLLSKTQIEDVYVPTGRCIIQQKRNMMFTTRTQLPHVSEFRCWYPLHCATSLHCYEASTQHCLLLISSNEETQGKLFGEWQALNYLLVTQGHTGFQCGGCAQPASAYLPMAC